MWKVWIRVCLIEDVDCLSFCFLLAPILTILSYGRPLSTNYPTFLQHALGQTATLVKTKLALVSFLLASRSVPFSTPTWYIYKVSHTGSYRDKN